MSAEYKDVFSMQASVENINTIATLNDIEKIALKIRDEYNIKNQYPLKVVELANKMGFRVFTAEFKDPNIYGAISMKDDPHAIYVNINDSLINQRFTVAHEVAHYILHMQDKELNEIIDMYYGGEFSDLEREANMLAMALLMGTSDVEQAFNQVSKNKELLKDKKFYGDRVYEDSIFIRLAKYFGVSKTAIQKRLYSIGLV